MFYMIGDNSKFERAAIKVLLLRDPDCRELLFGKKHDFLSVYAYALGIASVSTDSRILDAIRYRIDADTNVIDERYAGTDEENIEEFIEHFNDTIVSEVRRYDCNNALLLRVLDFRNENEVVRSEEERQKDIDELEKLLRGIYDSYDDFVWGILAQTKHSNRKCRELIKYLKTNPLASSSDIVDYVLNRYIHDAYVVELEGYAKLGM